MARRKRLSEGKQNIIQSLSSEYDIKTADDIQNALKDLLGGTIESMVESELYEHPGYEPYERSEEENPSFQTRKNRNRGVTRSR